MKTNSTKPEAQSIVVTPASAKLIITPYAMAKMSEDLHMSSQNYSPDRFPLINYFLYCASVELGLKAAILNSEYHERQLRELKDIGHDLEKLIDRYERVVRSDFLSDYEKQILAEINKYYKTKGLEYFTGEVMQESLRNFNSFPDIIELEKISVKQNEEIVSNQYYVDKA